MAVGKSPVRVWGIAIFLFGASLVWVDDGGTNAYIPQSHKAISIHRDEEGQTGAAIARSGSE